VKKTITLLSLSLATVFTSNAQWTEQNCPHNQPQGFLWSISVPQTDVLWVTVEGNQLGTRQRIAGRTTDGGANWNFTEVAPLPDYVLLKLKGIDDQTAFASLIKSPVEDSSRIYRTQDGGSTWQLIPTAFNGLDEACIDFHFFNATEYNGPQYQNRFSYTSKLGIAFIYAAISC